MLSAGCKFANCLLRSQLYFHNFFLLPADVSLCYTTATYYVGDSFIFPRGNYLAFLLPVLLHWVQHYPWIERFVCLHLVSLMLLFSAKFYRDWAFLNLNFKKFRGLRVEALQHLVPFVEQNIDFPLFTAHISEVGLHLYVHLSCKIHTCKGCQTSISVIIHYFAQQNE